MVLGVFAGILVIQSVGSTGQAVNDPAARAVRNADYPICGDYGDAEDIRRPDLKKIIYGRHLEVCESQDTRVTLTFTLSNRSLADMAKTLNIVDRNGKALTLYQQNCGSIGSGTSAGFDGIIVDGDPRRILFHEGDEIRISQSGTAVKLCPP
jgi:hypothetical protein